MLITKKTKLIAEIGWNHFGNIKLAKRMIHAAKNSGADIVKLQTWSVKNLKKGPWDKDGRKEIYKKAELNEEDYIHLNNFSKKIGIELMTSIFNVKDFEIIKKCNFKKIKIPSHEIHNLKLIKFCIKNFKEVLISTGAAKWSEIKKITKIKSFKKKVSLMHCVSSYPLVHKFVNMHKFIKLKKLTKKIGYSGHLPQIDDAIFALCLGANYIEKHFTTNNNLPGRDNKFALVEKSFSKLSVFRDNIHLMKKNRGLNVQKCELEIFKKYRGRWGK